jgi:ribonuclease HII
VAGLDEAGRGCWAGPVYAAAVILTADKKTLNELSGVRDSKQMTPGQRTHWAEIIKTEALCFGVGFSTHDEIDESGIVAATRQAMLRALDDLGIQPQFLLLDYMLLPSIDLPQMSLVRGDGQVLSIAAASILAKTSRDEWMMNLDEQYPGYGFARHKGYGTPQHRQSLNRMGISTVHRRSFAPIRQMQTVETKGKKTILF